MIHKIVDMKWHAVALCSVLLCSAQANMAKALACQHKYPTYTETFNDFEFSLHVWKRGARIQCEWRQQHQAEPNWAQPNRSKPPENKKCCACICRNTTISKYIYGSSSKSLWLFYRLWLIHFCCSTIRPFPFTKFLDSFHYYYYWTLWFIFNWMCPPVRRLILHSIDRKIVEKWNDDFSILLSFYAFCYYFSGSDYVRKFFFLLYNYSFPTVNIRIFCVCFLNENVPQQINSILLLPRISLLYSIVWRWMHVCTDWLVRSFGRVHLLYARMSHKALLFVGLFSSFLF